jgi:hypothetical protein
MIIFINVWYNSFLLPVVISAAAGDHVGCNDLIYAAAPKTCWPETDYRAKEIKYRNFFLTAKSNYRKIK